MTHRKKAAPLKDGPLLDLSDPAVEELLKKAKARGFVNYAQLAPVLPDEVSADQIEDMMSMLSSMGIKVFERAKSRPIDAELRQPPMSARVAAPRQGSRDELDGQQTIYLTASDTLTQFNAIVAAALCAASATAGSPLFKAIAVAAILLHVVAAFVLCWAARPVPREAPARRELRFAYNSVNDTFQNYLRGWRMTVIAMTASATALGCFAVETIAAAWRV
jgi:hypothetical protein